MALFLEHELSQTQSKQYCFKFCLKKDVPPIYPATPNSITFHGSTAIFRVLESVAL